MGEEPENPGGRARMNSAERERPGHRESCEHPEGFRTYRETSYLCPLCGTELDDGGLSRWVREAEKVRDESYLLDEGDGFREIVLEERQREVYRRRKLVYELRSAPRLGMARPEMALILHDPEGGEDGSTGSYNCRIFYKEPRPASAVDRFSVRARTGDILDLKSDPNPVLRSVARRLFEFHSQRLSLTELGHTAPGRRVFYANEL
jgi:hypothetical protein